MQATLRGPYGQTVLEPTPYPYVIGRTPNNQLVVNDPRAVSQHAVIRQDGQSYSITDLGNSDGTFVNEQRLVPNVPRLLYAGDLIRIGDTRLVYEAGNTPQLNIEPTVYAGSSQGSNPARIQSTVYGGFAQGSNPSYPPMVAPPPAPYTGNGSGGQQVGYAPPAPVPGQKKASRRGLWIALGAIIGVLLIGAIAFGVFGYVNRSTPTKTLNAFCSALKSGDYPTAYNQLSSGLQAKYGSEAMFAAGFSNNGGLGKVTNCTLSEVNDGAGTGTISYNFSGGSTLVVDYTLIDENGASRINGQHPRSTPSLTLTTYCNALVGGDYQTAYDQLSSAAQSQETEAQFAANFKSITIAECAVSNANDSAGTGTITYTLGDGRTAVLDYTLVNENNTWKINSEQRHS